MENKKNDIFKEFMAKKNQVEQEVEEVVEVPETVEETAPEELDEFGKFKQDFFKEENNIEFLKLIDNYREAGYEVFKDNDEYVKLKFQHPKMNAIILEPSFEDITSNKAGSIYLVKPIYLSEYESFVKTYGDRHEFPEEFCRFVILKGILSPRISVDEIEFMPSFRLLALKSTISNLSDFNKQLRILEV